MRAECRYENTFPELVEVGAEGRLDLLAEANYRAAINWGTKDGTDGSIANWAGTFSTIDSGLPCAPIHR